MHFISAAHSTACACFIASQLHTHIHTHTHTCILCELSIELIAQQTKILLKFKTFKWYTFYVVQCLKQKI